jgi:hypothetical protein
MQDERTFFDPEQPLERLQPLVAEEILSMAEYCGLMSGYIPTKAQMETWDLNQPQRAA